MNYAVATMDKKGRPAFFHCERPDKTITFEIFRDNSTLSLRDTFDRRAGAAKILTWLAQGDIRTPNIGDLIRGFELDELPATTMARDYGIPSIKTTGDSTKDAALCQQLVSMMRVIPDQPYQILLAKAQSVYAGLERAGLMLNYTAMQPRWNWETFSGRSKCMDFNVQGWSEPDVIRQNSVPYECVQIHFDWICADLRIAALLSGCPALNHSFIDSDPYTFLSKQLTGCGTTLRDDAKLLLLKTINSLNHTNEIVNQEFPVLCKWLSGLLIGLRKSQSACNMVGRKFAMSDQRSERSVFNAVLQGSVAAAMQNVLWHIRRTYPTYLVTDIHDGVVLAVPRDKQMIAHIIENVGKIFFRPFQDVFSNDLQFPYRVSVGVKWKEWKEIMVVRSSQT